VNTPEQAWAAIAARAGSLATESIPRRAALGRTLAEALSATTEVPSFDVSAMDGFAYRGEESVGALLPISVTIAAGDTPGARLASRTAARIWTGAPVPLGADRVVPVEQTEEPTPEEVRLVEPVVAAAHIRRRAEILAVGAPLLDAGAVIGPAALSLFAGQGIERLAVTRAPRVALLATGDEVVPPGQTPQPGQLRDSHTDYLLAAGLRLGLEFTPLGIAPDDADALVALIGPALESHDVVLICGGVSMGGRDLTEPALEALGATVAFDAVAVQPGKPLLFAHRDDRLIFGLPGNPGSVMVSFRLFVRPALERLLGRETGFWAESRRWTLSSPLPAGKKRDRFVPARAERPAGGELVVRPLGVRGSHDQETYASADLLLRIPAGAPAREAGESVEAIDWE
jgi:molybdopterin molybdotransferase